MPWQRESEPQGGYEARLLRGQPHRTDCAQWCVSIPDSIKTEGLSMAVKTFRVNWVCLGVVRPDCIFSSLHAQCHLCVVPSILLCLLIIFIPSALQLSLAIFCCCCMMWWPVVHQSPPDLSSPFHHMQQLINSQAFRQLRDQRPAK